MDEAAAEQALRQFGETSGLAALVEEYIWLAAVGFALLLLKDSIQNLIAGLALSIGCDYDESDVVYLQTNGTRRAARIANLGALSTTFYLYEIETDEEGNEQITGGTLLKLPNSQLPSLRIERPLDTIPLHHKGKKND
jgi:hypothetical protein